MRIKTQAILINEETYPIAVACLPAGFAAYPFANVNGYWLVINVPGSYDRNSFDGDNFSPLVTVHNLWISNKEFTKKYNIINQKPGRKPEGVYWVECELAVDKELKAFLETTEDDHEPVRTNMTYGAAKYGTKARITRRHVIGYDRS